MFNRLLRGLCVAAALVLPSDISFAATASTTIPVTALVSKNCSIALGSAIAFGAYDPLIANSSTGLNAVGIVTVACTKGATGMTIGINNGLHASGSQRQMVGADDGENLQYNIYKPPNNTPGASCIWPGTTAWTTTGSGLLTLSTATSKAPQSYSVCGTIPGGQDVSVDTYTDTVTATINF